MSQMPRRYRPGRTWALGLTGALAIGLSSCGTDSMTSVMPAGTARGSLIQDPPLRIASLDAATFGAELGASASGAQLLQVAGQPTCGVDFYYLQYNTVGGAGEPTTASGALMVPTGSAAQCRGGRAMVL